MTLHRAEIEREIERYGWRFPVPYELAPNLKLLNELLAEVVRLESALNAVSELVSETTVKRCKAVESGGFQCELRKGHKKRGHGHFIHLNRDEPVHVDAYRYLSRETIIDRVDRIVRGVS